MYTLAFWKSTAERVVFTALQVLAALIAAGGFGLTDLTTGATWSVVGMAAVASLVKNLLAGLSNGSPSAINSEVVVAEGAGKHALVGDEAEYVKDDSPRG